MIQLQRPTHLKNKRSIDSGLMEALRSEKGCSFADPKHQDTRQIGVTFDKWNDASDETVVETIMEALRQRDDLNDAKIHDIRVVQVYDISLNRTVLQADLLLAS